MGFIRQAAAKITGADQAADSAERAATDQANATRASADLAAKAAQEQAAQAARSLDANAARATATATAQSAAETPLENPDVAIGGVKSTSASGAARARRAKFGTGTSGGVSI
jgi:hypothetical protein